MPSVDINKALQQAVEHHRAGRLQEAERGYQAILKAQALHPDANHNMGVLALQMKTPEAALPYFKTALDVNPKQGQYWLSYIDVLIRAGQQHNARQVLRQVQRRGLHGPVMEDLAKRLSQGTKNTVPSSSSGGKHRKKKKKGELQRSAKSLEIALKEYRSGNFHSAQRKLKKIVTVNPRNINALWYLSIVTQQLGNIDKAISILKQSLLIEPDFSHGYNSLGLFYYEKEELETAAHHFQKALVVNPNFAEALNNLGMVLYDQGHNDQAERNFEKAISLKPDFSKAFNNLGNVYKDTGWLNEAEASYRKALSLDPEYVEAHNNLGNVHRNTGRLNEALASYRQAIVLKPDYAEAYNNLGNVLGDLGQLNEAESSYRQALSFKQDFVEAHSNLLFYYNLNPGCSVGECLAEAQCYGAKLSSRSQSYADWPALNREVPPLRVGLVSGDFRRHPVGYFLDRVLAHLCGSQIELLAYVTQPAEDDLTQRFKSYFTTWRSLVGMKDAEAARCIHDDGVHILIDLAGHTAHNRLPVFSWKPAPVQVSWLGYFATTGIEQMDYLVADKVGVPLDQQTHFTEKIWYLPETRLCFTPPDVDVPIAPLPALDRGYVTFGSFQVIGKLNDSVLNAWSRILNALPNSVLRLQNRALDDAAVCRHLLKRLEAQKINSSQVVLCGSMPRAAYLAAYAEVDILLDTFPYPGGTTTCEALWMGVPTLTLAGSTLPARQGASLLTAAGLPEWVAVNQDEYVAKSVAFACDLSELIRLREGLREQVGQSPLFDAARFAGNLETALLTMWRCRS